MEQWRERQGSTSQSTQSTRERERERERETERERRRRRRRGRETETTATSEGEKEEEATIEGGGEEERRSTWRSEIGDRRSSKASNLDTQLTHRFEILPSVSLLGLFLIIFPFLWYPKFSEFVSIPTFVSHETGWFRRNMWKQYGFDRHIGLSVVQACFVSGVDETEMFRPFRSKRHEI